MSGYDVVWRLERFGDDDDLLAEECIIPPGIAFELLRDRGLVDEFHEPECYKIGRNLFLSARSH